MSATFELPVSRYMSCPVVSVGPDELLTRLPDLFVERGISSVIVVDKEHAVGVISRRDLVRVGRPRRNGRTRRALHLPAIRVSEVMSRPVQSVAAEATVRVAAHALVERRIHRLLVEDAGRPVGVFSTRDVIAAVLDSKVAAPISSIMSAPVLSIDAGDTLRAALDRLAETKLSGLVVTEGELPVGLFTETEALAARGGDPDSLVEEAMTQALLCLPVATPLHRAAGFTLSTSARRILAVDHAHMKGLVSGLDFARVAGASGGGPIPGVGAGSPAA